MTHRVIAINLFSTVESCSNVVALVGGGTNPMLGEISLAHNGVLFLDENRNNKRKAPIVGNRGNTALYATIVRSFSGFTGFLRYCFANLFFNRKFARQ